MRFPNAVATMEADADALLVTIEAQEKETIERMKGVVQATSTDSPFAKRRWRSTGRLAADCDRSVIAMTS